MAAVFSVDVIFQDFWDAINDPIVGGLTDKTKNAMGTLSSMAACCGTYYSRAFNVDILGTSGLVRYGKDYLYGYYILSACTGIYMCKYSVWNTLRCNDTGY